MPCDARNRGGSHRLHQSRVSRIKGHRLMKNVRVVRLCMRRQLAQIIRAGTLRVVLDRRTDPELREDSTEIAGPAQTAEERLHQIAALLRVHLRGRVGHVLLHRSGAQACQGRSDGGAELVLGYAASDLIVVLTGLLVTEVVAHHIIEDAAELIEE